MSSTTKVLILLLSAKLITSTGVFQFNPQAKGGNSIYSLYLGERSQCLRACYDESECKIAEYNEGDGYCRLYKEGNIKTVKGYELTRDKTDSSCMTETFTTDITFQKIQPLREITTNPSCKGLAISNVTVIKPFEKGKYRFFFTTTPTTPEYTITKPWLYLSKKAEKSCASVPVFHKANHRRLFFGEIYNTTGYYFFDGYVFADKCVLNYYCLGMREIQEYKDNLGNFFYDEAGKEGLIGSNLGQNFYIADIAH